MSKQNIPLWKKSCIWELKLDSMCNELDEIAQIEYKFNGERTEEFNIFLIDVSARAEHLRDIIYEFTRQSGSVYEDADELWDDLAVAFLHNREYQILGYDAQEMDYFSLFEKGFGSCESFAIEEAQKRLERLLKKDLINHMHQFMIIVTSFYDVKKSYDALVGALDFIENEGLNASQELTRDIEYWYKRLKFVEYEFKGKLRREVVKDENLAQFEAALECTNGRMWVE